MTRVLAFVLMAVALASTAPACVALPPPPRLIGENDADYSSRAKAFRETLNVAGARDTQERLFAKAVRVSIARVVAKRAIKIDDAFVGNEVAVEPLASIKGVRGREPITLADRVMSSCGPLGDGSATAASVGSYVLLFENPDKERPNGMLLSDLREPMILQKLEQAIRETPGLVENSQR